MTVLFDYVSFWIDVYFISVVPENAVFNVKMRDRIDFRKSRILGQLGN